MSRSLLSFPVLALITLAGLAALTPFIVQGAWRGLTTARNAPVLWLPSEFQERRELEEFERLFQCDDMIVVSWEGCTVDDERLQRFSAALESSPWNERLARETHLTGQALTGYEVLRGLMAEPLELSRNEALQRLSGQLVGPDGETSCLLLVTRWIDAAHARGSIRLIIDLAEQELGVAREQLRLAGSTIEGAEIDDASGRSFVLYLPPAALVCVLLCRWFLGNWRLTLAILSVSAFSGGLALAMVHFAGATLNAVLLVMAPLMLLLGMSAGIHLINYYFELVAVVGVEAAPRATLKVGWRPCAMAAGTTVIGLLSLVVSDILPVRQFGVFGSLGLGAVLGLLFLVVPGALAWYGKSRRPKARSPVPAHAAPNSPFMRYAALVQRAPGLIVLGTMASMVACSLGLARITTSVSIYNLLPPGHPLIRDYTWMEQHLGPLVPLEIIVHFDDEASLDILQRADLVRQIHGAISEVETVAGTISALTFLPEIPTGRGMRQTTRRSYLRTLLRENREQLVEAHWLAESPGRQAWRISARAPAFADLDYGRLLDQLGRQIEPLLEAQSGVHVTFTGVTPVVHAAQQQLLADLFNSFLTAFAFVSLVMMVILRSVPAGLVAMIPNVFPALILFGLLGWLGVKIDIGAVMTASVALGIAVDDTIHYLTWFRRGMAEGLTRPQAVRVAMVHCGRAMIQMTMICGLGLLVFGMSEFIPTRRFAWMMATLLAMALVGDILLLPALLTARTGVVFQPRPGGDVTRDGSTRD